MIKALTTAAVTSLLLAGAVEAKTTYTEFGKSEPWTIYKNDTTGLCFGQRAEKDLQVVQMGFRVFRDELSFIGVWNTEEAILKPGERREMRLDIDGKPYTFTAIANKHPLTLGLHGAFWYFNNPAFIADIEAGEFLTIHVDETHKIKINLAKARPAMEMAAACMAEG